MPMKLAKNTTVDPLTHIDGGIRNAVRILQDEGVETFESCEGGENHSFPEPTIRFHGNNVEGFRAYSAAITHGLNVFALRRVYDVVEGELTGPWWEIVFRQGPVQD